MQVWRASLKSASSSITGMLSESESVIADTASPVRNISESQVENQRTEDARGPSQCCMTWHSSLFNTGVPQLGKSWYRSSRYSRLCRSFSHTNTGVHGCAMEFLNS